MKSTILIAEDDPGIQEIFQIIFENAGYNTLLFDRGDRLLADDFLLPDIFLLDRQLSGTDGIDICMHLKARIDTRDIPVIMISATPGLEALSKAAGANDFIEKPFDTQTLLDKVAFALKGRSANAATDMIGISETDPVPEGE